MPRLPATHQNKTASANPFHVKKNSAAMASPADYPWTFHFVWKLLHNDPRTLSLIANNPFPSAPPHYIRARLYRYQFAPLGEKAWWKREPIGEWLPALSADDEEFRRILAAMFWLD